MRIATALFALVVSFVAHAGPPPPLDDPFLDNLVGKWRIERRIDGTFVVNSLEAKWVLQHHFLQLHMKDVANPPKYEAIVLIGYDGLAERYVAHWMDVYGGAYSGKGVGRREANTIEFEFPYPDGPFYNTFFWQPNEKGWRMLLENMKDGKRVIFAEDTVRHK